MNIKKKRESIQKRIDKGYLDMAELQESCTHVNVEKEYHGSTGNYDRSADCYWIQFICPDCGKQWTEDQ